MNWFKKIPLFLFLLPVFFCLHGAVENFGVVNFGELFTIGIYISIGLLLLFFGLFIILRNKTNAAIISFYIGLIYLFYGAIQDWLRDLDVFSFMHRYSVLLPVLTVSIFILAYFLKRFESKQRKVVLFLNSLFLIYCVLDSALLIKANTEEYKNRTTAISFNYSNVKARPNVYYLLFDGYPGNSSLLSEFKFDNSKFYDLLHRNGFTVLPSHSNYGYTIFAMSSIFNMRYVNDDFSHHLELMDQEDFRKRYREVKNAEVFSIFKKLGYKIENYSIFDIDDKPCVNPDISFLPVHGKVLTSKILHKRLLKNTGWWFNEHFFKNRLSKNKSLYEVDKTNLDIESMLRQSLSEKRDRPVFSYSHFVMPHLPYFRDSSGTLNEITEITQDGPNINESKYFLPYLKYCNLVIESLVSEIIRWDSSGIVIVMSDHGFRNYGSNQQFLVHSFDNFCAVRFPGNRNLPFDNSKSSVNFFRYLFNSNFGQQIPYLQDSIIYIDKNPVPPR